MRLIEKLSSLVYQLEKFLASIFIITMFVSLVLSVFFRYVLNNPLHWTDEIAIFSMIWVTFLGGSMSLKRQESTAVTFITDKLSGLSLKTVKIVVFLITFIFCLFIFILAFQWITSPMISFQRSVAMQMPMLYPYLSVPVGFGFMTIHVLELLLKSISSRAEEVK